MAIEERTYHAGRFELQAFGPTSMGTVLVLKDAYTDGQAHTYVLGDALTILAGLDSIARGVLLEMRRYYRDDVLIAIGRVLTAHLVTKRGKRKAIGATLDACMIEYTPNERINVYGRMEFGW